MNNFTSPSQAILRGVILVISINFVVLMPLLPLYHNLQVLEAIKANDK